jgi:hypothetical protein
MTNETNQAVVTASGIVSLQIGRTGEKAKYQGRVVSFDLATMPPASLLFALEYGLRQYVADGTAGSEDQTGYDVGIDQRLKKLAEGDFSRAKGERQAKADTAEARAVKNAISAIKAKLAQANVKAEAKVIKERAEKMVGDNPKWLADARKQLAEEAKMAEGFEDILGDLLGVGDDAEG